MQKHRIFAPSIVHKNYFSSILLLYGFLPYISDSWQRWLICIINFYLLIPATANAYIKLLKTIRFYFSTVVEFINQGQA